MKLVGGELFAQSDLLETLDMSFTAFARDACFDAVLANPRASQLALRRAVFASLEKVRPVVIGAVTISGPEEAGSPGNMVASCTIAYEGLHDFFRCRALAWPPLPQVRGTVHPDRVVLTAEGFAQSNYLARPLFWSEIAAIERHLSVQRAAVARWQRSNIARVRLTAEQVHARLNRAALRRISRECAQSPIHLRTARQELWAAMGIDGPGKESS